MDHFLSELERFRRRWQRGLLRCALLELLGGAAAAMALLCWLDLFLALAPAPRIVLNSAVLLGLLAWLAFRLVRIFRIDARAGAVFADTLLNSPRREILSALEIGAPRAAFSPLQAYLAQQGVAAAGKRLAELAPVRLDRLPANLRKRLIIMLAVSLLPALFNPGAAWTLMRRCLWPTADIAPYSAYVFTITPQTPEVVYGADQVIQLSIAGAPVDRPVRFATRKGGQIIESPCYQAGPGEYVQRLERVMQPLEFCFRVGKARSAWHRVKILYQPHVVSAQIRLTPPAYAHRPETRFDLGSEPLKGLKGTRVEMTVRSNRPLKRGELTIEPSDGRTHSRIVHGDPSGPDALTYRWEIGARARLSLMIHDILGTPAREPLVIRQELVADEKPVVALTQPLTFSLATPGIKVPVAATIEDDIGIRRCDLFRSLKGYRSRAVSVDIEPGSATRDFAAELDLAGLGVVPGQVIELFLEASDTNPDLTGSNASDIARIKIISDDEYAKMVRARTTVEAFEGRFRIVADGYASLIGQLEKTEADLRSGRLTREQARQRMDRLRATSESVSRSIKAMADDYAAFDLEKRLAQTSAAMLKKLDRAFDHPGWTASDPKAQLAAVVNADNRLKGLQAQSGSLRKDAAEVAAVSRVMAMGAWYRSLLDRQKIHVGRLGKYVAVDRKGFTAGPLAQGQAAIRSDLKELGEKLETFAQQLPAEYDTLRESSLEFVQRLRALQIPATMLAGENACLNDQPRQAWNYAGEALEKMEEVLGTCRSKCFAQICSGDIGFKVPDPLSRTMAQMLEGLMAQYRQGVGWGDGTGAAGVGLAGAWEGSYLNGYSAFNVPVYGPERKNPFASEAAAADGDGNGPGAGPHPTRKVSFHEAVRDDEKSGTGGAGFSMDAVPPRYRKAVNSFYSGEQP
jgi:hypothetical protein